MADGSASASASGGSGSGLTSSGRRAAAGRLERDREEFTTSDEVDVTPSFDALGLRDDLLRGIYAYGKRQHQRHLQPSVSCV